MALPLKKNWASYAIALLLLGILFSFFEIFNLSTLYKDQVETPVIMYSTEDSENQLWNLVKKAESLSRWITIFQCSIVFCFIAIIFLLRDLSKEN